MAIECVRRARVLFGCVTVAFFALATPACGGGGDEGGVAPGAGGASGGGWSTPRWFAYVQDATMMVIDGAVTSSVTRYELADDMSAHGMLGGFEPSADGTAIVLDPYYDPGSDPVKPQQFVDLAGAP